MEMEEIKAFFATRDRFAQHCGIELTEVSKGRATARMEVSEHHLNGVNIGHGAAIFTLADVAFAAASNSHGTVSVAINANISFLRAAGEGALIAEAEEVSYHPKLGNYDIRIKDDEGNLVATFQGLVYRKQDSLDSLME